MVRKKWAKVRLVTWSPNPNTFSTITGSKQLERALNQDRENHSNSGPKWRRPEKIGCFPISSVIFQLNCWVSSRIHKQMTRTKCLPDSNQPPCALFWGPVLNQGSKRDEEVAPSQSLSLHRQIFPRPLSLSKALWAKSPWLYWGLWSFF